MTGDPDADDDAWRDWLTPVRPEVLRAADPLLPEFSVLCDDLCGPYHSDKGLVTELEQPLPVWEGPVPDFAADPRFRAAFERADMPNWYTLGEAAMGARNAYCLDERVRNALATGHSQASTT